MEAPPVMAITSKVTGRRQNPLHTATHRARTMSPPPAHPSLLSPKPVAGHSARQPAVRPNASLRRSRVVVIQHPAQKDFLQRLREAGL